MTYIQMLQKDLSPQVCQSCGQHFWLRIATADKIVSSNRPLKCWACMLTPFPFPYARQLTEEELKEWDWDVQCQAQNIKQLKEATDPIPSPTPMKQKHVSTREEQIRINLKNSLLATGTSFYTFGQAAGFGSNATQTIKRFVEGAGKRATMAPVLRKIERELERRGWLKTEEPEGPPEAQKILEEFKKTPTDLFVLEKKQAEASEDSSGTLTPDEMFTIVHAVLSLDQPKAVGLKILGKLFPNVR